MKATKPDVPLQWFLTGACWPVVRDAEESVCPAPAAPECALSESWFDEDEAGHAADADR